MSLLRTIVSHHFSQPLRFTADLAASQSELSRCDELLRQKEAIEKRLEEAVAIVHEREQTICRLEDDLMRQTSELEQRAKQVDSMPIHNSEDSSVILTLKNEVSNLREQLNRAYALQSLTCGPRDPPVSPTFAPTLRHLDNGTPDLPSSPALSSLVVVLPFSYPPTGYTFSPFQFRLFLVISSA
jgi:hypothetical protein